MVPSSATRSTVEQRDLEEILISDAQVPERVEAEIVEPASTPSAESGRPEAIRDLSQLSAVWSVAARASAESRAIA